MTAHPLLFSPAKISSLTYKYRLVMTPVGCGLANTNGMIRARFIAYYRSNAHSVND